MKDDKTNIDLTDQLKKDLRDAKTKEELDALLTSAGMELNDNEPAAVAKKVGLIRKLNRFVNF